MPRAQTIAILAFLGTLVASQAYGADISGGLGAGDATCTEALANAKQVPEHDIYVQWASGQISGMISRGSQKYPQNLTISMLASQLHAFCRAHPQESVFVAAATIGKRYAARVSGS
ncbi:MAG: hypothetical protein WBW92_08715 [Rhodanobacteraceae bacterium]